jgi:dCMP deaminase
MMDRRISREQAYMLTAQVWSQRSTCMRRNVGAVVVVDRHIVSHGYNGAPPGEPHCDGVDCVPVAGQGCVRALHAEANAIKYIPRGFENIAKYMFTTESPCLACATLIHEHKVVAVYYLNEYRLDTGIRWLLKQGTSVFRMTPSGMIVQKYLDNDQLIETLVVDA